MKVTGEQLIEKFKGAGNELVALVEYIAELQNRVAALEVNKKQIKKK